MASLVSLGVLVDIGVCAAASCVCGISGFERAGWWFLGLVIGFVIGQFKFK
jgi:hypothetical protein